MGPQSKLRALGPAQRLREKGQGKRQETTSRNCRSVSLALQSTKEMMSATNCEIEFTRPAYAEGVIYER